MKKFRIFVFVIFGVGFSIFTSSYLWAGWSAIDIGSGTSPMYGIALGKGRNDGVNRIYAACGDTKIYEFSWSADKWTKEEIGYGNSLMFSIVIGDGRNEGKNRIYSGGLDDNIYEFTWENNIWSKLVVRDGADYDDVKFLEIGPKPDDILNRIYFNCSWEWAGMNYYFGAMMWDGRSWVWDFRSSRVYGLKQPFNDLRVGNGRNDGINRIYYAVGNSIYEFISVGGDYPNSLVVGNGELKMSSIYIGKGRGDNIVRVYGANMDGYVYEFTWDGTSYDKIVMGFAGGSLTTVYIGDARNSGLNCVYAGNANGNLYEFFWTGSTWTVREIYSFPSSVNDIVIGDGRNNGKNAIYVACGDNHVYELFLVKPTNLTAIAKAGGKIDLSWQAPSGVTVSYYNIYRATFTFTSIATANVLQLASNITQTSYSDTATIEGERYYYRVTAIVNGKESDVSNIATDIADATPPSISHTPITTGTMYTSITISATVTDISHPDNITVKLYYRNTGSSSYSNLLMNKSGNTYITNIPEHQVTDLGIDYYIEAVDIAGNSGTMPPTDPSTNPYQIVISPLPPDNLTAIAEAGGNIKLSWSAPVSSTTITYDIYRATFSNVDKTSTKIASGINTTFFLDTSTVDGQRYYYVVVSKTNTAESVVSNSVTEIADASGPNIVHSMATSALAGIGIRVKATITDVSHIVGSATLYYCISGIHSWTNTPMFDSGSNIWVGDIPSSVVTTAGVEYYITANDILGNTSQTAQYSVPVSTQLQFLVLASQTTTVYLPDGSQFTIPAGALSTNKILNVKVPQNIPPVQEGLVSPPVTVREFSFGTDTVNFNKDCTLVLPYSIYQHEQTFRIYSWDGSKWAYENSSVNIQQKTVTAAIRHASLFAVIADITPPEITNVQPVSGDLVSKKQVISADVRDTGSGVDEKTIKFIISKFTPTGEQISVTTVSYPSSEISYLGNTIKFTSTQEYSPGHSYTVDIFVGDRAGNIAKKTITFSIGTEYVVEAYTYPNPFSPDKGVNIKYILNGEAREVKIKIYDLTGRLIKVLDGTTSTGTNIIPWDGKDETGNTVGSDVFLCHIHILDTSGKEYKKILKIASWSFK